MCEKLAMTYGISPVFTERKVRSCLFNALFVTISYHGIEISVKSRYSYHEISQ